MPKYELLKTGIVLVPLLAGYVTVSYGRELADYLYKALVVGSPYSQLSRGFTVIVFHIALICLVPLMAHRIWNYFFATTVERELVTCFYADDSTIPIPGSVVTDVLGAIGFGVLSVALPVFIVFVTGFGFPLFLDQRLQDEGHSPLFLEDFWARLIVALLTTSFTCSFAQPMYQRVEEMFQRKRFKELLERTGLYQSFSVKDRFLLAKSVREHAGSARLNKEFRDNYEDDNFGEV